MAPDAPPVVALPRPALLRMLDVVDQLDDPQALTLLTPTTLVAPDAPPELAEALGRLGPSRFGVVVFWGVGVRAIIEPPFPVEHPVRERGLVTAPLRDLLLRSRTLGVVLVRLGGFSLGIYRNGAWEETKTGGRFVKNRHRKGGQSQRRFERIREGQIREHFDDVAELIRLRLLPRAGELDALVLGGDRHTVQALLRRAPLPPPLAAKLHPRTIDTPEPRREVLERSPTAIWTSRALVVRDPRIAADAST